MDSGVLVLGYSAESPDIRGLEADEKAVKALQVPVVTVSTASSRSNAAEQHEIDTETPSPLKERIDRSLQSLDCRVLKIGQY